MRFADCLTASACGAALALASCGSDGLIALLPNGSPDGGAASGDARAPNDSSATRDASGGEDALSDGAPCVGGLSDCSGRCVDLLNDPRNCGGCGRGLAHYQYCHDGTAACLPGFTLCGASCVDLTSNPDHCGGCAHPACASGENCESGVCRPGGCTGGRTACPVAGNRNACADLGRGVPYCGDCTTACGPDQVCAAGTCQAYAPASPCNTCPCTADCAHAEGATAVCCAPIANGSQAICVHGGACP